MSKIITVYICFAVLLCGHRSKSSSTSTSMEDSVHTRDRIGLLIPEIPEYPKEQKKHVPNTSNNRKADIITDDFNLKVENINDPKSELDYERDGSQNTPKLQKFTSKSKIYPHVDGDNEFINNLTPQKKVNMHYRNRPKIAERARRYTRLMSNFDPETPKRKHKHAKLPQVVSDELDTSNTKFLAKLHKAKKSKHHETSDISMNDTPKTHKDQNNNLDKHRLLKNHTTSQNKHSLRENTNHKKYNKYRYSQPESDKEIQLSSYEKQDIRKKIKSSLDFLRERPADFRESEIHRPKKLPLNKNINDNQNPRKEEFTITISDIDENEDDLDSPLNPFEGSPLLTIDTSKYQSHHKVEPHEPSKKSLRENKADKKQVKQQPIEIGMIDTHEQFDDKLYDKENIKSEHKDANVEDFFYKKPDSKQVDKFKPVKEPDIKLDNKHKVNKNKHIIKKNFNPSLKISNKQEVEELDDNFSKAEILLTDNEKDKSVKLDNIPDDDDAEENTALRNSGRGRKSNKRWLSCLGKKALKICRKACRGAYLNVCKRLRCSSKAKKDLRYECKKNCKRTFGKSKYSSESSCSSDSSDSSF